MADESDHILDLLREADLWCDRYELALQKGERLSPEEFLTKHGRDAAQASGKLLAEMRKLEVAYVESANSAAPKDTEVLEPSAKKRVGRYELLRPLGAGGFGEVWVAFDPQLDREIAIKIPHAGILGDAASVGRFYREAKAAAKLKHPNIVRVHDAGSDGSTHFIAAEFIPGRTLREYCAPGGMDIREAVRIVADIAAAVFYAHRSNIVHRDIKPGNILMDAANQPHLTDSLPRSLPNWVVVMLTAFGIIVSMGHAQSAYGQGADGGKFDGALWSFSMIPKDKNLEKRTGMFRINGNDLYQRSSMEKPGFDRKMGTKTSVKAVRNKKGKIVGPQTTTLEFFDLQSNGLKYTGMKGKVVLKQNKLGEWSGRFVDAEGLHWEFKCSRKQE